MKLVLFHQYDQLLAMIRGIKGRNLLIHRHRHTLRAYGMLSAMSEILAARTDPQHPNSPQQKYERR